MNPTELEKLYQLNTMVLSDVLPARITLPTYLFTETPDNQESVLQRGTRLCHAGKASEFLLIDNQGESEPGYPGAPPWLKRLRKLGVPEEKISLIPFTTSVLHTLSEACAMVRFARERGWSSVIIVAPPFHLLRCFLSAVTAAKLLYPELRVYCQVGITQPWNEEVAHSQQVVRGLRRDLLVEELRRIKRYQRRNKLLRLVTEGWLFLKAAIRRGNLLEKLRAIPQYAKQGSPVPLVSTDDALEYLERRDRK